MCNVGRLEHLIGLIGWEVEFGGSRQRLKDKVVIELQG
jgi:hypothetical protein